MDIFVMLLLCLICELYQNLVITFEKVGGRRKTHKPINNVWFIVARPVVYTLPYP